ncbi:MAG: cytochrome c nitrite reductase small subunit [Gemmatimonas sp.]|nr:cytochrome c nitrite reductase small subunit [Gemmatimonas sp.]
MRWLLLVAAVLTGAAIGIGAFTFVYAEGYSYLSDDPSACANCHVMDEQYSSWIKSSHSSAAVCNDCHTPHDLVGKYTTKARNGFWHSYYFTLGGFHEPIQATGRSRAIAEAACRDCHQAVAGSLVHGEEVPDFSDDGRVTAATVALVCTRCHSDVGHWTR